ncbi:MAG: hypothetical protein M5U17_11950 [Ignavibacterium sp.]|nr:hypothetical protein [Ignavibacterium sp.]
MKFKLSKEPLSIFAYSSLTDIVMLLADILFINITFCNTDGSKS